MPEENKKTNSIEICEEARIYSIERCLDSLNAFSDVVCGTVKHYQKKAEEWIFLNPFITVLVVALLISVGLHFVFFTSYSFSSREETCKEWFGDVYLINAERKYLQSLNITTYDVLKNLTELVRRIDSRTYGGNLKQNEELMVITVIIVSLIGVLIVAAMICACCAKSDIIENFTFIHRKLDTLALPPTPTLITPSLVSSTTNT